MCSCSGSCNCNSTTIPRGPQGAPGKDGTNGTNGTSATITAGSAALLPTGSNPTVTNVSTNPSAAIFNFGIPAGEQGVAGVSRLYSTLYDLYSSEVTDWVAFPESTFTIYAGTLVNVGDSLMINLLVQKRLNNSDGNYVSSRNIRFNSTVCGPTNYMISYSSTSLYNTKCEIIRTGVNTAKCISTFQYNIGSPFIADLGFQETTSIVDLTSINFAADNTITMELQQEINAQIVFKSITIDKTTAI